MPIVGRTIKGIVEPDGYPHDPASPEPEPREVIQIGVEIEVYDDRLTGVRIVLSQKGDYLRVICGNDSMCFNKSEWRGLYSGVLNIGPGRDAN